MPERLQVDADIQGRLSIIVDILVLLRIRDDATGDRDDRRDGSELVTGRQTAAGEIDVAELERESVTEPELPQQRGAGGPDAALHMDLRLDDVCGDAGDAVEFTRLDVAGERDRFVGEWRDQVGEPGGIVDQAVGGTAINEVATMRLQGGGREGSGQIDVVALVPDEPDPRVFRGEPTPLPSSVRGSCR